MGAAGERVGGPWAAFAAAVVCLLALLFGGGLAPVDAPLVWIGALALVLAAALNVALPLAPGRPAVLYLGCLAALVVWAGASTVWSISADRSWAFTNHVLVYAAFGLVGVLVGGLVSRAQLASGAVAAVALVVVWALAAKCVPALSSSYERLARLRSPFAYWNELALVCAAGVPLALWLARRRRAAGAVLLYLIVVTVLLTYSRFGVLLAALAAAAYLFADRERVEGAVVAATAAVAGGGAFGIALALPGITSDAQTHSTRARDGGLFALVLVAGAVVVALVARALDRRPLPAGRRARAERALGFGAMLLVVVAIALAAVFAGRIWRDFTGPAQIENTVCHLCSASSSNRWTWWQEAWHAFTRHPLGGTGGGTFELTNQMLRRSPIVVDEPHNVPLQLLSELGIVGFGLYLGVAAAALRGAHRARSDPAGRALGLAVVAFFVHGVADKDWNFVATCGPLLFLAGALLARPQVAAQRVRRPFVAVAAFVFALGGVYSLAAPWLAERNLPAASLAQAKRAHGYDPLSVDALLDYAAYENADGHVLRAGELYREATAREPENAETWYELGRFYFDYGQWAPAYDALNTSYTYDRFGPAATPCGLLDQARTKAHNFTPKRLKRCPGSQRPGSP